MIASFHRRVAFSVLFAFLAGLGSWELQDRALTHEVEHAIGLANLASNPGPAHDHERDAPRPDSSGDDGDHAVLHAIGVGAAIAVLETSHVALDRPGIVRTLFVASRVLPAAPDPPLRPPRALRTLA